jgi:thiamine pyrophosphate-dependent acetolactate synthase large subunit-like protein
LISGNYSACPPTRAASDHRRRPFGRALANEGIEKAFILCGGHIMPILYGMRQAGIEIIDMRHECSTVYAAIAYERATGKLA